MTHIINKHEARVTIKKEEFDRINRLLEIESLEDMTDEELYQQGAKTNHKEKVFFIKFDNGSTMSINLCSGLHNYYDDVVWTSADGKRNVVLDSGFELDDIEVEIESELYIVEIKKED